MDINWNTNLYGLIGNPINKSLSPKIHNFIFNSLDLNNVYLAFDVEKENLQKAIEGFKVIRVKGFNVTIPFKQEIMKYLDEIDSKAKIIGAVNTVKNENGKLVGYNTDGDGFLQVFQEEGIEIPGKNILLIGAGGAAYAIGSTLALNNVATITIANRNQDNALNLKEHLRSISNNMNMETSDLNLFNLNKKEVDMIINTTSIGMYPMENLAPIELNGFTDNIVVYDIIYKPKETKLLERARFHNYKTINGIHMLLNQAILSQKIWNREKCKINSKKMEEIKGFLDFM